MAAVRMAAVVPVLVMLAVVVLMAMVAGTAPVELEMEGVWVVVEGVSEHS